MSEKKVKSTKKEKVKSVRCQQVGRGCNICGTGFEDEVCNNGHQIGHSYTISIRR